MTIKLYANENFPLFLVEQLRKLGYDILTMKERGLSNKRIPDVKVVEFACSEQLAVITFNKRDFARLHQMNPNHFGIILCTVNQNLAAIVSRIHEDLMQCTDLKGKLIRIHRK